MMYENILMAWKAITNNKLRSGLTILGIVIGIASVIAMLAIGQGANRYISSSIEQMGTNLLIIRAANSHMGVVSSETAAPLSKDDAIALKHQVGDFATIVSDVNFRGQVKFKNLNYNTTVTGVDFNYLLVRNFKMESGMAFTKVQENGAEKVCIVGHTVLDNLCPNGEPLIGETIRINREPFNVIGIYTPRGSVGGFRDEDDQILIPLDTALKRFKGSDTLNTIYASIINKDDTNYVQDLIEKTLRHTHQLSTDKDNDFDIRSQLELLDTMNSIAQAFTILLGSIALISLLVGGIGIMNILLVSVTERTKEIGIRKAIGAYERDILFQFLVEAVMLCSIGGVLGIGLGIISAKVIGLFSQWKPVVTTWSILLSLGVSFSVGVFFGYYPARSAAKMNPIEALRYE